MLFLRFGICVPRKSEVNMDRYPEKCFVLAGNWAYTNRGCEAIVRGTSALLREEAGTCRFISHYFTEEKCTDEQNEVDATIIHKPFPFLKRYSLPWIQAQIERRLFRQPVSRYVARSFQHSLPDADAVLMLGGDTFTPDYGNADVYFALSSLVVRHNVPIALWGASIGPFTEAPDFEKWAVEKLRRMSLLCARETETLAYLDGLGLKNIILTADPSFYMQPATCELPGTVEAALGQGCIGLNLSPFLYSHTHPDESAGFSASLPLWTRLAADIVRTLLRRFSDAVLLVPHVISEMGDVYRDDSLFLQRVAQLVQEPERVLVLDRTLNAAQVKWAISRLRLFAGARTHSTLAAISSGVPTICIGYSVKARGIAQDVYGHLDWLVKGQALADPAFLCERMVSLSDQEAAIRSHLEQVKPIFRQRARDAARHLMDILPSR
jgi:colanic acid/amylovoran biosynthesis protein